VVGVQGSVDDRRYDAFRVVLAERVLDHALASAGSPARALAGATSRAHRMTQAPNGRETKGSIGRDKRLRIADTRDTSPIDRWPLGCQIGLDACGAFGSADARFRRPRE